MPAPDRKVIASWTKEDLDAMDSGDLLAAIKAAQEQYGAANVQFNGTGVVRRADGSIKYDKDHPDHPDNVAKRAAAAEAAGEQPDVS